MNYKQKMIDELIELRTEMFKLEQFYRENTLMKEEQELLDRQLKAMSEYYTILHDRIMIMLDDCKKVECCNVLKNL